MNLFLPIVCAVVAALSALTYILLRKTFPVYRGKRFAWFFLSITILTVAGAILGWASKKILPFSAGALEIFSVWLMAEACMVVLLPLFWAGKKYAERSNHVEDEKFDPKRRQFLKSAALALPAASLGISSYGTFVSSKKIILPRHTLPIAGLAPELDGFKLAHISDAHIGLFFSVDTLRNLFDRLLEEKPDALAITGDLIDDLDSLPALMAAFEAYSGRFPKGIWFSWGNHEHMRDFSLLEKTFARSSIHVLRNTGALLAEASTPLYMLGVDYPMERDSEKRDRECLRMMETTLSGIPDGATKILLTHHPILIDNAYDKKIELTLAGHTHGGQIAIFGQPIFSGTFKYMLGMYKNGDCLGYVSAGTGSWFPFRLGCPAEAAIFTLRMSISCEENLDNLRLGGYNK